MKVTLTEPAIVAGSYVVCEQRDDGTLVLRPETSEELIEEFSNRAMSGEEFLAALDRMAVASQREGR